MIMHMHMDHNFTLIIDLQMGLISTVRWNTIIVSLNIRA